MVKIRFTPPPANKMEPERANRMVSAGGNNKTQTFRFAGTPREKINHPAINQENHGKARLQQAMYELQQMVGLKEVKELVQELLAFLDVQRLRARENLATEPMVLHMIFLGNPGTGKTTVARLVGRILKEMGILAKGHTVEVERADLVGEYIGHTAQKTRDHLKKALGGILFVDEAYALARGGEKDFGKEAIDTMVKGMEDHKDQLVLILAGYREEMEWLLQTNPGLRSRFPLHIYFPDYTIQELMLIAQAMLQPRQYILTPEAEQELERQIRRSLLVGREYAGNARLVRNILERAIRRQARRLVETLSNPTKEDLIKITRDDLLESAGEQHPGGQGWRVHENIKVIRKVEDGAEFG